MPTLKRVPKRKPTKKVVRRTRTLPVALAKPPISKTVIKPAAYTPIKMVKKPARKVSPMTADEGKLLIQFLKSFGHKKNIYTYNEDGINTQGTHKFLSTEILGEAIKANTSSTCSDVYFYINNKRKLAEVTKAHACYIDLDAGRDSKGQYLTPTKVEVKKTLMRGAINSFQLSPSWVVETRNGYQLYWLLDKPTSNISVWNGLQKKLVNHFAKVGADCRAIKANQIFRVPFTIWWKPWEKKTKYMTRICSESNGHKVSITDLQNVLLGTKTTINKAVTPPNQTSAHWANLHKNLSKSVKQLASNSKGRVTLQPLIMPKITGQKTVAQKAASSKVLSVSQQKTETLELTIEFLNQVQNILYYSNNKFLASSAKKLAEDIGQLFCI